MSYLYYKQEWVLEDSLIMKEIIRKYIGIKHNYDKDNCFSLINKIYKNELNKPLTDTLTRLNTDLKVNKNWHKIFTTEIINKETGYFKQINLPNLKSFDIILFKDKKNRINHFGIYCYGIEFLHLPENGYSRLDILDDEWKDKIYGCYRKI